MHGGDAIGLLDGHTVLEPLNLEVGISHWDKACFEVQRSILRQAAVFDRRSEDRWLRSHFLSDSSTHGAGLQAPDLAHGILVHGIKQDGFFAVASQSAFGHGLANGVGGPTGVGARVFGIAVHNIKSDISEVIVLHETRTALEGNSVVEPLYLHRRIRGRDESCLEVSSLAFNDFDVLEGCGEDGTLLGGLFNGFGTHIATLVFKHHELLHRKGLVLGFHDNVGRF